MHVRAWAFPTRASLAGRRSQGPPGDWFGQRCVRPASPSSRSDSVLPDDATGDAPAVAQRDALFFGSGPDVRAPCPGWTQSARPLPLFSASPTGVFDVGSELPAQSGGVAGVQIDLVVGATDPELDR